MFTLFELLLSYTWLSQIAFHTGFQLDFWASFQADSQIPAGSQVDLQD